MALLSASDFTGYSDSFVVNPTRRQQTKLIIRRSRQQTKPVVIANSIHIMNSNINIIIIIIIIMIIIIIIMIIMSSSSSSIITIAQATAEPAITDTSMVRAPKASPAQ